MPRYFFFGFVRVPMYEYRVGLTIAQVQLLTIDQPLVVYKKDNANKPKPGQKGYKKTAAEAQKDYERWKARHEEEQKRGKKITLSSFLGG